MLPVPGQNRCDGSFFGNNTRKDRKVTVQEMSARVNFTLNTQGETHMGSSSSATYMWEEDDMRLQKRNGNVPGIVGFAEELDQL